MMLQHVILGLLREKPSSGYDLNKRLEGTTAHFWLSEQSQIYRALYKMSENNWVRFDTVVQHNSPNKKVYFITEQGERELERWLREPLEKRPSYQAWLAQLFFGRSLTDEEIRDLIVIRMDSLRQTIEAQAILQEALFGSSEPAHPSDRVRWITVEHSRRVLEADIHSMELMLEQLSNVLD